VQQLFGSENNSKTEKDEGQERHPGNPRSLILRELLTCHLEQLQQQQEGLQRAQQCLVKDVASLCCCLDPHSYRLLLLSPPQGLSGLDPALLHLLGQLCQLEAHQEECLDHHLEDHCQGAHRDLQGLQGLQDPQGCCRRLQPQDHQAKNHQFLQRLPRGMLQPR